MLDLRSSAAFLIEHPLVPVPPLEGVVARARRYQAARLRKQMSAGVLVVSLALTVVVRAGLGGGRPDSLRMVGDPPSHEEASAGVHFDYPTTSLLPEVAPFLPYSGQSFEGDWNRLPSRKADCPAHVNPNWDPIRIMGDESVEWLVKVYNHLGGICGRALELVKGSLCNSYDREKLTGVVAVVGTPFDKELESCIAHGTVDSLGVPVVGGDGLSAVQHQSALVFPVGTSAAALARTAGEHARTRGARTYAVVYDSSWTFAREAVESIEQFAAAHGGIVKAAVDLAAPLGVDRYRQACRDSSCDMVLLALQPDVAQGWLQTRPAAARVGTTALPTLLTGGFPEWCFRSSNDRCNGLTAWTGLLPWFTARDDLLEAAQCGATEGSALAGSTGLAASLLVDALQRVGPSVTRTSLRTMLETGVFDSDAGFGMAWGSSLPRLGNPVSQQWRLDVETAPHWMARVQQRSGNLDGAATDAWTTPCDSWTYDRRADRSPVPAPTKWWSEAGSGWHRDPE